MYAKYVIITSILLFLVFLVLLSKFVEKKMKQKTIKAPRKREIRA